MREKRRRGACGGKESVRGSRDFGEDV